MPDPDNEFLILSLPDKTEIGSNLRLLAVVANLAAARKALADLGSAQLGKVVIMERKALYVREAAVTSKEIDSTIMA